MNKTNGTSRRAFVACCACACGARFAKAAEPSSRNAKSLKAPMPDDLKGAKTGSKKTFDIAYCGIYCTACELHLKENEQGQKCKGCTHPSKESECAVFTCAKEKKVANCGLCESFESCEKLKAHHEKPLYRQVARRTCAKIKQEGMDAVIAEQKVRWTCKACGKMFPWNTSGTCPHCGKAVNALSEKDT